MKKTKKTILAMLALILLGLIGCSNEPTAPKEPETWTQITTFKDLNGTWSYAFKVDESADNFGIGARIVKRIYILDINGDDNTMTVHDVVDMKPIIESTMEKNSLFTEENVWNGLKEHWKTQKGVVSISDGSPYNIVSEKESYKVSDADFFKDNVTVSLNNTKSKIKSVEKNDDETSTEYIYVKQ